MNRRKPANYLLLALSLILCNHALPQRKALDSILRLTEVSGIQLIYANHNATKEIDLGVIADGSQKKIEPLTIFQAASLSKCVFAYAVLKLCDRGIIQLDTPLLRYMGTYHRFPPNDPAYSKITARMVLRHTTGLPNWGNDSSVRLLFQPDSMYSYSGEGYWFLQKVIEHKLSKKLNEIMKQEVFLPLGMNYSSYVWKPAFDPIASMEHRTADQIKNYKTANAAFSLLTNARDYNLFLGALLQGRGLKPSTHRLMFQESVNGKRYGDTGNPANPYIFWGLGVGLLRTVKGEAIWHWGDNGPYKCFFIAYPQTKERLVYFTHSQNGLDMAEDILNLFVGRQPYWTTRWLDYGFSNPVAMQSFKNTLNQRGYEQAPYVYNEYRTKDTAFAITENDLNKLGYQLISQKRITDAVDIFLLNTRLHPDSFNAFDSLGEAYEDKGEKSSAILNYRKSLELNPKNTNAEEHLKKLETK